MCGPLPKVTRDRANQRPFWGHAAASTCGWLGAEGSGIREELLVPRSWGRDDVSELCVQILTDHQSPRATSASRWRASVHTTRTLPAKCTARFVATFGEESRTRNRVQAGGPVGRCWSPSPSRSAPPARGRGSRSARVMSPLTCAILICSFIQQFGLRTEHVPALTELLASWAGGGVSPDTHSHTCVPPSSAAVAQEGRRSGTLKARV